MKNKTILVSGIFNILHPGHLRLLRFAKDCGDYLMVAVQSDQFAGKGSHIPEQLRLEGVQSNAWVDKAFLMDESIEGIIRRLKPDIIVKGKEHEDAFNPELEALLEYGGQLIFSSGETTLSSLDLIRKEFFNTNISSICLPDGYMDRHNISKERLEDILKNIVGVRVCVIGDLIIDQYITCEPLGMSQEDPTLVVTPLDSIRFIGGAGIVAAHASGLGASVQLMSVTGVDEARDFAADYFQQLGVAALLLSDQSRPTTLKQRYRAKGSSLLRVSHLHQGAISNELQNKLLIAFNKIVDSIDVLIFSDFNYGCLPQSLVNRIIEVASSRNILLAADSQSSSQVGDIGRFKDMTLITPTEREARLSLRSHEDGLVVLAEKLRHEASATHVLLKLGEEGLLINSSEENTLSGLQTDRIDALNYASKDVAGAGDSLLVAAALALSRGANIWEAACLGSLAAAIQVGRVGNTPIKTDELRSEIRG